ncbi:MAG: hypothetical protein IKW15_07840 [Bacteroidales bacterium]|nr:hypothetical protein [Bacteroidales bacterium]
MTQLEKLMAIPPATPEMRQLATIEGFVEAYEGLVKGCKTYKTAYEVLELQHERIFGFRKYDNYGSFKVVYWRKQRLKSRVAKIKK